MARPIGMLTPRRPRRPRSLLVTTALAAVLLTGACATETGDSTDTTTGSVGGGQSQPDRAGGDDGSAALADDEAAAAADGEAAQAGAREPADPQQRAVIATGTISLLADDVAEARFAVQRVLDTHQGTLANEETETGDDGELERARLVLRIPSERVEEASAALEEIGDLEASQYGEEDVTTEVIDVAARIRAQEKSVRRIEALLAEAENLRTLMSIEQELARRQAELDSLTSQQKWLADQTDLATLTVHLERAPHPEDDDTDRAGFLGGLTSGWDAFVTAATGTAAVLGFALPWLVALVVLGVAVRLGSRSWRRRT